MTSGEKLNRRIIFHFQTLVIELDENLYGLDNHLVEHRRVATGRNYLLLTKTHGFQSVKIKMSQVSKRFILEHC